MWTGIRTIARRAAAAGLTREEFGRRVVDGAGDLFNELTSFCANGAHYGYGRDIWNALRDHRPDLASLVR